MFDAHAKFQGQGRCGGPKPRNFYQGAKTLKFPKNKVFQCHPLSFYWTLGVSNGKMLDLLVLYWDWVQMNHQKRTVLLGRSPVVRPVRTNFKFGVMIPNASKASKDGGPGAHPRKDFCGHTLQIVGKCPFCQEVAIETGGRT